MDKTEKNEILEAITALGVAIRRELAPMQTDIADLKVGQARLEAGVADLKAGQVRLNAKVDKVGNRLHGDIEQVRHETAFAYFTAKGRTDQIGDMLLAHIGEPHERHKPAA